MRKVFRWVIGMLAALLLLAIVLWSVSRLRGPTEQQEAALAVLGEPWQPAGRNAFAAVWLLQYDVAESSQATITARDMKRIEAQPRHFETPGGMPKEYLHFESVAKGRFRDLSPTADDHAMLCKAREPGCLDKVRADLKAYVALAARNERLFDRVAALSGYDFFKSGLPPRIDAPMPNFQHGSVLLTRHAIEFVSGNVDVALGSTCRDLATWKRLGSKADSLIARMVGIVYSTDGYGKLLADMLVELPQEHVLPKSCAGALEPMQASELSMCRPMQGEFRYGADALKGLKLAEDPAGSRLGNLLFPLFYQEDMTRAEMAMTFAPSCSAAELAQMAADVAITDPPELSVDRLECVSNFFGCTLAIIARPAYADYTLRAQDQGARMKLIATLAWLRSRPDDRRPLATRLADRPEKFKSATRDIEIADGGKAIRIRQFEIKRAEYWKIPLPPFQHEPARVD